MRNRNTPSSWQDESAYWRNTFSSRPYTVDAPDYSLWEPAYRYGYESANRCRATVILTPLRH
jgi:hypothetical protein